MKKITEQGGKVSKKNKLKNFTCLHLKFTKGKRIQLKY